MINNVVLVGRLTKDSELRFTGSGIAVASFTLAVDRHFKTQDGQDADFIQCVVWRKTAEALSKYTRKGSLIAVTGRIQTRHYENNEGKRIYVTEVLAENIQFLDSKSKQVGESTPTTTKHTPIDSNEAQDKFEPNKTVMKTEPEFDTDAFSDESIDISDDDLPF